MSFSLGMLSVALAAAAELTLSALELGSVGLGLVILGSAVSVRVMGRVGVMSDYILCYFG